MLAAGVEDKLWCFLFEGRLLQVRLQETEGLKEEQGGWAGKTW